VDSPADDDGAGHLRHAHLRELAVAFDELGDQVRSGPRDALDSLVHVARDQVPGAHSVSVTTLRRGRFDTAAATDDLARRADAEQYDVGRGPCIDAALDATTYRTGDIANDDRWPEFGRRAAALGVRSMLSYRLSLGDDDTIAALNLFSTDLDAFDDDAVVVGLLLATHGAVAVMASRDRQEARDIHHAVESNRVIGTAVGILMSRHHLSQQQAFDLLSVVSQNTNRRLAGIAEDVVAHGDLEPGIEVPPR
jgi:ANTAR domain/GAF domain